MINETSKTADINRSSLPFSALQLCSGKVHCSPLYFILTLPLHPYGSFTVRTRDQILLKVCIPSQSHTLIPFTFLVSDHFISPVQPISLSTQTSQYWNADKNAGCCQREAPVSPHSRHTVGVWWHAHWAISWEKLFFQIESKQMSGHELMWSIMLLGMLFQEREAGGCEVPAKNRGIWVN